MGYDAGKIQWKSYIYKVSKLHFFLFHSKLKLFKRNTNWIKKLSFFCFVSGKRSSTQKLNESSCLFFAFHAKILQGIASIYDKNNFHIQFFSLLHCKEAMLKIRNKYSQKKNCVATVPISTFRCLWAIYIFCLYSAYISAYSAAGNMWTNPGDVKIAHWHMNVEIGT